MFEQLQPRQFAVSEELERKAVLACVRAWYPELSWAKARELLAARLVLVNGSLCLDEGRHLKTGDYVQISTTPCPPPPGKNDIRLRFLDRQIVVVEKPAGMTTLRHAAERSWPPARKALQPALDDYVPEMIRETVRGPRYRKKEKDRRRDRPSGLRLVQRLDRETSGLLVFARSAESETALIEQFKAHIVDRCYLAVVHGAVTDGTIESDLIRDRGDGLRGSSPVAGVGRHAVSHVRLAERLGDYSLIECRLETGRTHQIRIHMADNGHLVCGETKYQRRPDGAVLEDHSSAPRLALHATRLGFEHPLTHERLEFDMPLPADLQAFVERLRRR